MNSYRAELEYNDNNPNNKKCAICGIPIEGKGDTCGHSHRAKLANAMRGVKVYKVCPVCGVEYCVDSSKRNRTATCGLDRCRRAHLSNISVGEKNPQYGKKGSQNASYRGGRITTSDGYTMVLKHGHPNSQKSGYILEHVLIMSTHLGRPLRKGEVVHHIDGDKSNNNISNLELTNHSVHSRHHAIIQNQGRDDTGKFIKGGLQHDSEEENKQ